MNYNNLSNRKLALVLAIEIVKAEIDNDRDFSDESPFQL